MANSNPINLTRKVAQPVPGMPVNKSWQPNVESITQTMPFGGQVPKMVDVRAIIKDKKNI